MNRTRFSAAWFAKQRKARKGNYRTDFMRKYNPEFRKDNILVDGKRIVPIAQIDNEIEALAKGGGPIGIQSLYAYIRSKFWGISRAAVEKWLRENETIRNIQRRPNGNNVRKERARPGQTRWVLKEDPYRVGVDLIRLNLDAFPPNFALPKQINYVFVAVQKATGITWCKAITSNSASQAKKAMERFFAWMGGKGHKVPAGVESDGGGEFRGVFAKYITSKTVPWKPPYPANYEVVRQRNKPRKIHRYVLKLVPYVEARNAHIQRAMVMAIAGGKGYHEAIRLAYQKVNRIKSSITGKMPEYFLDNPGELERYADIGANSIRTQRRRKPVQSKQKRRKWVQGQKVDVLKAKYRGDKQELVRSYTGGWQKKGQKWTSEGLEIQKALPNGKYFIKPHGQAGRWYSGNEIRLHQDRGDPDLRAREQENIERYEKQKQKKKNKKKVKQQKEKQKKKKQLAQAVGRQIPARPPQPPKKKPKKRPKKKPRKQPVQKIDDPYKFFGIKKPKKKKRPR